MALVGLLDLTSHWAIWASQVSLPGLDLGVATVWPALLGRLLPRVKADRVAGAGRSGQTRGHFNHGELSSSDLPWQGLQFRRSSDGDTDTDVDGGQVDEGNYARAEQPCSTAMKDRPTWGLLPGQVSVVEDVVTVQPQVRHVVVNLSHVDNFRRDVRNVDVAEDEFELQPLGQVEEDGEEDAGENVRHKMDDWGMARNSIITIRLKLSQKLETSTSNSILETV